jgi:hypothetical protein
MHAAILVLCLGDSVCGGWSKYLSCENVHVSTAASAPAKVPERHYGAIVFNCGLHDAKWRTPIADYQARLETMLGKMSADRIYFCTSTPGRDNETCGRTDAVVMRYNTAALEVMARHHIPVIDLHALCVPHPEWNLSPTNIHYTEGGYREMAKYIKAQIGHD